MNFSALNTNLFLCHGLISSMRVRQEGVSPENRLPSLVSYWGVKYLRSRRQPHTRHVDRPAIVGPHLCRFFGLSSSMMLNTEYVFRDTSIGQPNACRVRPVIFLSRHKVRRP